MTFEQFLEEVFEKDGQMLFSTALDIALEEPDYSTDKMEQDFLEAARVAFEVKKMFEQLTNSSLKKDDVLDLNITNNEVKITLH